MESTLSQILAPDVSPGSRTKGKVYFLQGAVTSLEGSAWWVDASVRGTQTYAVAIERNGDAFTASCQCRYFEDRFEICKHIWAALLAAEQRGLLAGDGRTGEDATIDPLVVEDWNDPEFQTPKRRARPAVRDRQSGPSWERFLGDVARRLNESETARRSRFVDAQIVYVIDRAATLAGRGVALQLQSRPRKKTGEWGKPRAAAIASGDMTQLADHVDREVVPLLLGASDVYGAAYNFSHSSFRLIGPILDRVLPVIVQSGRTFLRIPSPRSPELIPLKWDEGPPWRFRLEVVHASRHEPFSIDGRLVRGGEQLGVRQPSVVLDEYLIHDGMVSRLDARGASTWLVQLRGSGPVAIPPDATGRLVDVLARSGVDPTELPEDLRFEIAAESPRPFLNIRGPKGVQDTLLEAELAFDYGGLRVAPDSGMTAFDRERRTLVRRDASFERSALAQISRLGFTWQWDYLSSRQILTVPAVRFSEAVRVLAREGWQIEADGRVFRSARGMRSEIRSGVDWFELHTDVDFGEGGALPLPRLLAALKGGHHTVKLDDGTVGMVPEEWLRRWGAIADMGEVSGDHVRFRISQASLLDAALASQPSVRVDERFVTIRRELDSFSGIAVLDAAPSFAGQLREYQREALGWFAFLQRFGVGGCLADDMGLGKTVMVIAWLDRLRAGTRRSRPSLVVAPRSVVFNWKQEAAHFAPELRVLDFSGAGRATGRLSRRDYDLALTTYGTLRRDAMQLRDIEFDYIILDEAQTIKNAGTAVAKAARLLRANHRLALSGTPVENHLGELWSLFQFLNPGLLGTSSAFARHSIAAAKRDPAAMDVLARGLRPFILRRTKAQVAPELPARTELTLHCELQGLQRELYDELRTHYRASLLGRIERDGFEKSKMHVLEALLRLRQAACHSGLVDRRRTEIPSAKFEALLPLIAEVREEGHKCLVFSQFTSLLALLRERLDEQGLTYEYLDGQTRNREARVRRFQEDPACGLFLVSLKAGGLGLNLTAAEYVFLLDPWWNPAVEAQAIDRAHRIGQTRHVFAYRLIAASTVEEKIAELQQSKRELADAIIQADAGPLRNLKREDLEVLLSA